MGVKTFVFVSAAMWAVQRSAPEAPSTAKTWPVAEPVKTVVPSLVSVPNPGHAPTEG